MRYATPEIVQVDKACTAVRGTEKMGLITELTDKPSISAYEADE